MRKSTNKNKKQIGNLIKEVRQRYNLDKFDAYSDIARDVLFSLGLTIDEMQRSGVFFGERDGRITFIGEHTSEIDKFKGAAHITWDLKNLIPELAHIKSYDELFDMAWLYHEWFLVEYYYEDGAFLENDWRFLPRLIRPSLDYPIIMDENYSNLN